MPHHVYANGNEISSRSSSGKSAGCFPDVCFSPPTSPATPQGVPIPYANTCSASDIRNGSKTVVIKNKEIALESHSYFKSSVGDATATKGLKKGIRSSNVDGKGFFQTWSQNVKVEGKGVCRHMDMVTHNHTNTGNTVSHPFISTTATRAACSKELITAKKLCKNLSLSEDEKEKKKKKKKSFLSKINNVTQLMDEKLKGLYGYTDKKITPNNAWLDDYCDGLWVKPLNGGIDKKTGEYKESYFEQAMPEMDSILSAGRVTIIKDAATEIVSIAIEEKGYAYVAKKTAWLGVKLGVKGVVGGGASATGAGIPVGGVMAAWSVADIVLTANDIANDFKDHPEIKQLKNALNNPKKIIQDMQEIKDNPTDAIAKLMTLKANSSKCIKAKKCILVEYKETTPATKAAKNGKGCCPGQTGHHIMPKSMFKYAGCKYKEDDAPVICLEGTSNTKGVGSHGDAHSNLTTHMKNNNLKKGDLISFNDALYISVEGIKDSLPDGCDQKCIRAQLLKYHKKCSRSKIIMHDGSSGPLSKAVVAKIKRSNAERQNIFNPNR